MTLNEDDLVLLSITAAIQPGPSRRKGDFMATVWVTPDKQLRAEYRFRWWNTDHKIAMDGGADDDEKNFFLIGPVPDSEENRQKIKHGLSTVAKESPGFYKINVQEGSWTPVQFVREVLPKSGMHAQGVTEILQ